MSVRVADCQPLLVSSHDKKRARELSEVSFMKTLIQSRGSTLMTCDLPEAPAPNAIALGLRTAAHETWAHSQSVTIIRQFRFFLVTFFPEPLCPCPSADDGSPDCVQVGP